MDYKTPGVFIEEIPLFPPSVAPVATAIPAFIGHTAETQEEGGTTLINRPVRITSLLEFTELYGGAYGPPTGLRYSWIQVPISILLQPHR